MCGSLYNILVKNLSKSFEIIKTVKGDENIIHKIQKLFLGTSFSGYKRRIYKVNVLKNISFEVENQEFFGVLGPNGSGKTTLLSILGTLYPPDEGDIKIFDMDYYKHRGEIRKYIIPIFSWLQLHEATGSISVTGRQALERLLIYHDIEPSTVLSEINELSEMLDIRDRLDDWIMRLSDGMKMKIYILASMIIMNNYDQFLLLCDEPFIYLDVATISLFKSFILKEIGSKRFSVVISSNIPSQVEMFCNKVIILYNGAIIYYGTMKALKSLYSKNVVKLKMKGKYPSFIHKIDDIEILSLNNKGNNIYDIKLLTSSADDIIPELIDKVYAHGNKILKFSVENPTIDEVVLQILKKMSEVE